MDRRLNKISKSFIEVANIELKKYTPSEKNEKYLNHKKKMEPQIPTSFAHLNQSRPK